MKNKFYCIAFFSAWLACPTAFATNPPAKAKTVVASKSHAASLALSRTSGRVLKVERSKQHYRVKVLQESGRVIVFDIDKSTGHITQLNQ